MVINDYINYINYINCINYTNIMLEIISCSEYYLIYIKSRKRTEASR
jgi:hypothetical protein